jgi:SpoVK/Ycf46/Vps4 family AAA+-type ATPase
LAANLEGLSFSGSKKIVQIDAREIPQVELMTHLKETFHLLSKTTRYFFSLERFSSNAPFKGFMLHGSVGTGKTELVKQVARETAISLQGKCKVNLLPVDSSVIASPRWGESEEALESLFSIVHKKQENQEDSNTKIILLFDDIESLLLARGMQAAREWHYSLNAVFFHLVDNMNPSDCMVFATTNRMDLMDAAVNTRLYPVAIPNVPIKELVKYASKVVDSVLGPNPRKELVLKTVEERLSAMEEPTIRDCRQLVIAASIEKGILE